MSQSLAAPTLPSVLIADDDEFVRAAVGEVLSQAGYNIETAADGEVAALMAIDKDFDCIVSDIGMPGMDGMTLLRTLREAKPDLPVILLTRDPSLETAMAAVNDDAPGTLHTRTPASIAARTKTKPGSESTGVPASLTRASDAPPRRLSIRAGTCRCSLCSCRLCNRPRDGRPI